MSDVQAFWTQPRTANGSFVYTINMPPGAISPSSIVTATITELTNSANSNDMPFIGDATLRVDNIAPLAGNQIQMRVEIGWDSPLLFQVRLLVSNG
jgi:hypothetical protein